MDRQAARQEVLSQEFLPNVADQWASVARTSATDLSFRVIRFAVQSNAVLRSAAHQIPAIPVLRTAAAKVVVPMTAVVEVRVQVPTVVVGATTVVTTARVTTNAC